MQDGRGRSIRAGGGKPLKHVVDFDRGICSDPARSTRLEWLVTNGIGGFASGTVAGPLTRRYHGLLVAALEPPLGRTLLVSRADETVRYQETDLPLYSDCRGGLEINPAGHRNIDRFRLEQSVPVWTFQFSDGLLEKRIWMEHGKNTTFIRYDLLRASEPVELSVDLLVNHRDYHGNTKAGDFDLTTETVDHGLCVGDRAGDDVLYMRIDRGAAEPRSGWSRGHYLAVEAYRGLDATEDLRRAARFGATLLAGESITIVLSTDPSAIPDGEASLIRRQGWEHMLLDDGWLMVDDRGAHRAEREQLILAADQFLVDRPSPDNEEGSTVIAGYPWFTDWGRDTMIALPGLTVSVGRMENSIPILNTFAAHIDSGMIPNRFPDEGEQPEYNTVDATLWFFEAVRASHGRFDFDPLVEELYPRLEEIVDWHIKGTRHGIGVDEKDGLLRAGEPGVQLTWMDAKAGDWVVTPRIGKPVEVNALWVNTLRSMARFAVIAGKDPDRYEAMAERAERSFGRFWNEERGCCFDVIDGPDGDDPAIRPNQLFAVSLRHGPMKGERAKRIVDLCEERLLTPRGLRTLDPADLAYVGRYGGGRVERDAAYHQGTVWAWLIGPFTSAHFKVYEDPDAARSFLTPFFEHLSEHGLGSISEIFDGDPPHTARGCPAQAWSVAEVLRAWRETQRVNRAWSDRPVHP